jgi:hypothetical protein
MTTDWKETKEWKEVMTTFKNPNLPLEKDLIMYMFWFNHKNLTFYDFEVEFRKHKLPYRFFAEDPLFAKKFKGEKPRNQNNQFVSWVLGFSSKSIEECKKEFSEQCFDSEGNLERLKQTGVVMFQDSPENKNKNFINKLNPHQRTALLTLSGANEFIDFLDDEKNKEYLSKLMKFEIRVGIVKEVKSELKRDFTKLKKELQIYLKVNEWY